MTAVSAGQILCGDDGRMHIRIWGEKFFLYPADLGMLFFAGENVPLLTKGPGPDMHETAGIVGFIPSGRAVVIAIEKQRYILPRERFLAVAFGEEISCTFYETQSDGFEIEELTFRKRGESS